MREMAPQQVEGNVINRFIQTCSFNLQDEIEFDWNKNQKRVAKLGYVDVDDDDLDEEPLQKKKIKSNRDVEDNIELNYELKRNKLVRILYKYHS